VKNRSLPALQILHTKKSAARSTCTPAAASRSAFGRRLQSAARKISADGLPKCTLLQSNIRPERHNCTLKPFSERRTTALRALLVESAATQKDNICYDVFDDLRVLIPTIVLAQGFQKIGICPDRILHQILRTKRSAARPKRFAPVRNAVGEGTSQCCQRLQS
jgi:hypothetical protein